MKLFLKVNGVSILYAFILFAILELLVNVYRVSRLTGWNLTTVISISGIVSVVLFVGGTILVFFLIKKWMRGRKSAFWSAILWLPYFVLLIYSFTSLFPTTYEGDIPSPGTGFLIIGAIIVYPIYILIVNLISYNSGSNAV